MPGLCIFFQLWEKKILFVKDPIHCQITMLDKFSQIVNPTTISVQKKYNMNFWPYCNIYFILMKHIFLHVIPPSSDNFLLAWCAYCKNLALTRVLYSVTSIVWNIQHLMDWNKMNCILILKMRLFLWTLSISCLVQIRFEHCFMALTHVVLSIIDNRLNCFICLYVALDKSIC